MPNFGASLETVRQIAAETVREARKAAAETSRKAVTPKFLEGKVEGSTRAGQVIAAVFLPFVIVVSLVIVTVINNLMANVLGSGTITGEQFTISAFLVTALTLGALIMVAWGWFQFVRTSGFGAFVE